MSMFAIRPYSQVATYQTSWKGWMTFEQLWDDVNPNVFRLMRYYGNDERDIPDLIAHAFMRIWDELRVNPTMLGKMTRNEVLNLVLCRANPQVYRKMARWEVYLRDYTPESDEPDDFIIDGLERGMGATHASYTEQVDLRLDLERAIVILAEKYMDSISHLAALYYITSEVDREAAASIAGRGGNKLCWWLTKVVKPLREELVKLLDIEQPNRRIWKECYDAGLDTPLFKVASEFEARGKPDYAAAVYSLAKNESCKVLVERLNRPLNTIFHLRRTAHQALNAAYRCVDV